MAYEKKNYGKWNGGYKKSEKAAYKPKRGPLKPLMTEAEKSSAKVEDLAYATALNEIEYLGQDGWAKKTFRVMPGITCLMRGEIYDFDGGPEGAFFMCKGLRNERPKQMELNAKGAFASRITRLFQWGMEGSREFGNQGVDSLSSSIPKSLLSQIFRLGTSIGANLNEARHHQSDADFLSKANIALKEVR